MVNIRLAIFLVLTFIGVNASATPLLSFDGTVAFDEANSQMSVSATLVASQGISNALLLNNSDVNFTATLNGVTENNGIISADFGAPGVNNFNVADGNGTSLLEGAFTSALLEGFSGFDFGVFTGEVMLTGGSLATLFNLSANIVALELNLTSPFSATMFNQSFNGRVDGQITPGMNPGNVHIVEPSLMTHYGFLMLLLSSLYWQRRRNKH